MFLAIVKLACRPNAYFQVWTNLTAFGSKCGLKNLKMAAGPPWISEYNDFSNSESLCRPNAFDKVSAQCNLLF